MGKKLVLFIIVALALAGFFTRPSQDDFQQELQARYDVMAAQADDILRSRMHNDNVLDRMVATATPAELLLRTDFSDFYVFTMFVTEYADPMGTQHVRTFGVFQTFLPFKKPG